VKNALFHKFGFVQPLYFLTIWLQSLRFTPQTDAFRSARGKVTGVRLTVGTLFGRRRRVQSSDPVASAHGQSAPRRRNCTRLRLRVTLSFSTTG